MKIKKIKIGAFGKLKDKELLFSDKINVIFGENESGKSTLISFIKAMLFGINSKSQVIQNNLRRKYSPWNRGQMQGSIIINKDDEDLIITRSFGESKRFDSFEIKSNVTGEKREDVSVLLSEETFDKTAYFSQLNFKVNGDKNEEITSRLMNLKSTGEEEVSYEKGIKKLKDAQRNINKKGGILENLLIKKIRLQEDIIKVQEIKNNNIENIALLKKLTKKREEINNGYSLEDKLLKEELLDLKESLLLEEDLVFSMSYFDNITDEREIYEKEMYLKELQNSIKANKDIEASCKIYNRIYTSLFVSVTAIVIFIICSFTINFYFVFLVILALISAIALFSILFYFKNKIKNKTDIEALVQEKKSIEEELINFYKGYEVKDYIDFVSKLNQYRESKNTLTVLRSKIKEKEMEIEKTIAQEKGDKLITLEREISTLNNNIQNAFSVYKNVISFEEALAQLDKEIKFYSDKSLALEIAIKELDKAYKIIQNDFAPKLNGEVSKILSKITKGKYKEVKIGGNLEISLVENNNGYLKEADFFSIGTVHQIHFALRMGILNLIDNEKIPILLDEPFTQYDDIRLREVLEFLVKEAENRQIILFTCQKREVDILSEICDINLIKL